MRTTPQVVAASAVLILAMLACTMPSGAQVSAAATAFAQTQTAQAGQPAVPTAPGAPTATFTSVPPPTVAGPPTACSPFVTANVNANVRQGDSTDYEIIGFLSTGATAPLMGRNAADTWWYITYGGGHGWIAKSVSTAACLPAVVAVVVPPPLPPTPTPVPGSPDFAVTHIGYTFSEVDQPAGDDCPFMTAHITTNGPGDVTYKWNRSDGALSQFQTVHFNSAGTKDVTTYWTLGHVWEGDSFWLGIYVDEPNHQDFGHKTFTDACDG